MEQVISNRRVFFHSILVLFVLAIVSIPAYGNSQIYVSPCDAIKDAQVTVEPADPTPEDTIALTTSWLYHATNGCKPIIKTSYSLEENMISLQVNLFYDLNWGCPEIYLGWIEQSATIELDALPAGDYEVEASITFEYMMNGGLLDPPAYLCEIVETRFQVAPGGTGIAIGHVRAGCGGCSMVPITLHNTDGDTIAGLSVDMGFDPLAIEPTGCILGPAGEEAGKGVLCSLVNEGVFRVGVVSLENVDPIPDGIVAYVKVNSINRPSCGTVSRLTNDCSASDAEGNQVAIGCRPGSIRVTKPGDMNFDCHISIDELITVVRMYLGLIPVHPTVDVNCDGVVAIYEIIRVITCFLNIPMCPCAMEYGPQLASYSNSGCLPVIDTDPSDYPFCGEHEVIAKAEGNTISVIHKNGVYNCCPEDIEVTLVAEGNLLRLIEEEIPPTPCDCDCCYDIYSKITQVKSGEYLVQVVNADQTVVFGEAKVMVE